MGTGRPLQRVLTQYGLLFVLGGLVSLAQTARAEEDPARTVLDNRCSGCHAPREEGGKLAAIEFQRKTPEGWQMTLSRMVRTHGVELQAGEARTLVKYLSDHYGLAPAEVEPYRFVLEQRNTRTTQEVPEPLQAGCVQCHSYARIALQRRTPEEWAQLPDAKVALMPNIGSETASAGLLTDFWYDDAKNNAVPHLTKHQPFETKAWKAWQAVKKPSYEGTWKVVGHDPGKGGAYTGQMMLSALENDQYSGKFVYTFANGSKLEGTTTGMVYSGFQWRGVAQVGAQSGAETRQREILFASEDGNVVSGRRLLTNFGDLGMEETWYRSQEAARLLTVIPAMIRTGAPQTVKLFGMGFSGDLLSSDNFSFGAGVGVLSLRLDGGDTIVAEVFAKAGVKEGARQVTIRGVEGQAGVAVYDAVDYLRISPERGFARPGGIRTPKIFQQFEAIGYSNGPDEEKGTQDDVRLGRVGPITWNLEEYVKRPNDDDIQYVGAVDQNGLFLPNEDGPNKKRHMMEGNVGDVWVEAWHTPQGAKRPMGARAYLMVMPAKFVFPPIE